MHIEYEKQHKTAYKSILFSKTSNYNYLVIDTVN